VDSVNILLVDDQPAKLLGYEAILSDLGENLIKAHSAREALQKLLENDVAVVLVDVCMPELDGFELAQIIREHPRYQQTAIIFVSAIMMTDFDRLRGYQSGAVDYVSVPVVPEILRAKVTVFADLHRKTKQLEALNRELEQRVAERTERLGLALESAGAASWDWDVPADRLDWTRFSRLYGQPDARATTASDWLACMHAEDRARVQERIERLFQTPGDDDWNESFRIVHRDRGVRVIAGLGRAIRDPNGKVTRITGIDLDVTERVVAEEALKEADRRKDEFLATLAHELRNPLAPIRNALHLMGLEQLTVTQRVESREMIQRQVDHMVRLVDDLLDVSRITSGKIALRTERVDINAVLERAVETCQPLLDARGVSLSLVRADPPLFVRGDIARLVQVLGNILHNAAKYTDRGGEARLSAQADGEHVVLRVQDTGLGIPAEMLPRVFDLFTQVRDAHHRTEGGLGIGLALARRLVEMHGGSIFAESPGVGQGSTFLVRLPVAGAEEELAPLAAVHAAIPAARHRILVADDNEDAADSLTMLLEQRGHDVQTVYDGLAAVEVAEALRPEFAILDIGMPKLDGYDVARRIRASTWGCDMALIAQTGWGQPEDRRRAAEAGFDVHLTKPVEIERLLAVLAELSAAKRAP
jgi:PAS domain S-box-containing protein